MIGKARARDAVDASAAGSPETGLSPAREAARRGRAAPRRRAGRRVPGRARPRGRRRRRSRALGLAEHVPGRARVRFLVVRIFAARVRGRHRRRGERRRDAPAGVPADAARVAQPPQHVRLGPLRAARRPPAVPAAAAPVALRRAGGRGLVVRNGLRLRR
ncbi:ORF069 [Saltwater crocodilepox virus]|nr:hypothetical protein [Saltwater crocodilepox virus]AVD69404.1 hypothetical protein [Saltwater crocodilepox virus]QGT46508.1 ORF069 [Saltwater crocodilepox virus]QGT46723.1 ORF069 [Saltwater crocodilepox virus]QGT46940.1 ORF069 [Saltwater crocodilepox virus]